MEIIEDNQEANRCIRELAALSLLPAIWREAQPEQIRDNLADALQNSLRADLVYVRCKEDQESGGGAIRSHLVGTEHGMLRSVQAAVDGALGRNGSDLIEISLPGVSLRVTVMPLGPAREYGILAVGSQRKEFPTALERILLNVSANQAIIAFQSARQLAELRRKESNLRDFFENATVGLHWVNGEGTIIWANKTELSMLGYSREEYIGHNIMEFHADGCVIQDILSRLTKGESLHDYESELRCKDGSLRPVLIDSNVLFENGKFIHTRCFTRDIGARRKAEKALAEASEHRRLALEAAELGSWDYRFDLGTIFWDERCRNLWGLSEGASLDFDSVIERLHPEDRDKTRDAVATALRGVNGGDYQVEFRIVWANGSVRWVSSKGQVYFKEGTGAEPLRFIGTVRDITEEKQAREAIETSEQELRALADSIPQLAWIAKADGDIFWYNHRWFEYTGTELKQMEGWGWQSVHDPEILPTVVDRWKESISKGIPFEMEFPLRGADGIFRWFLTRVNPVRDKDNRVIRWFGTNTDVNEVRRAREALKEETRLLEILDKTGKSIAAELDLKKVVQSVTDSATELTAARFGAFFYNMRNEQGEAFMLYTLSGAPREAFEKLGHPRATALFGPTFNGAPPIRIGDVRKDARYGQMAPHHGMPKGHFPVVSYLAVPVVSRSGEVIGGLFFGHPEANVFTERSEKLVVGMAAQAAIAIDNARLYDSAQREIMVRKKVEEELREAQSELRRHAENLERQVAERTARLRETIQELEAFSYSVSHDMRSPLRAMQGYSDALLEDYKGKLDEKGEEYLKRIRRAASKMDLLIQDVLAYSRVAKGEIELKPLNVENVIQDVSQNYPDLQPDRAEISVVSPLPEVLGHEAYLTQIVSNFLSNAVKFVAPGKRPSITIRSSAEDDMVRISFEDNGIGISPQHQKQIFEIFGRVHPEKLYEGTGIGLAIVKKAAERMGGSAGVESQAGQGSRFFVLLKRAQ
ncbi:MAG TPA: PAS domain S-box protein [Verrucomicrobiae bacterium]|nr:PAS domain S-box protein [Verrucomicrobiae bacterium]